MGLVGLGLTTRPGSLAQKPRFIRPNTGVISARRLGFGCVQKGFGFDKWAGSTTQRPSWDLDFQIQLKVLGQADPVSVREKTGASRALIGFITPLATAIYTYN